VEEPEITRFASSRSTSEGALRGVCARTKGSVVLEQHLVHGGAGGDLGRTLQLPPPLAPCSKESLLQGHQQQRHAILLEMRVWEAGVLSCQGRCLTCSCAPCTLLSAVPLVTLLHQGLPIQAIPHSMPHSSNKVQRDYVITVVAFLLVLVLLAVSEGGLAAGVQTACP
jgi:hypothetical protein